MKGRLIIIIIGLALNYSPALHAQTSGMYFGMGLAKASTHIDDMTFETLPYNYLFTGKPIFFTASQDNASSNSTWSAYGGYQFNRYFAVEALYQPIGKYSRSGSNKGLVDPNLVRDAGLGFTTSGTVSTTDRLKLEGYGVSAVGSYPVANYMYLLGKLGVFYWNGTLDRSTTFSSSTSADKIRLSQETASGFSPILGIGLRVDVSRSVSVRAEWSHISSLGDGLATGKSDANITTFSAQINF